MALNASSNCLLSCLFPALIWLIFHILKKIIRCPNTRESTAGIPPGYRGLPLIGETLQFMAAANSSNGFYDFVKVRRLRYGNCFKTNIFGETHVFVSSTESAKLILNNDLGRFTKRYIRSIAEVVGHQSLLCASPLQHKHIRNRLANLFSTSSIAVFVEQFDQLVVSALSRWEHKGTIVILDEALKITFRAMCKMLMSLEREDELDVMQKDIGLVCEAMLRFPLRLPWTRFYKGLQARKRFMGALEKMVRERRTRGLEAHDRPHDFLQHLLLMEDDPNSCGANEALSLSDAQIKDNILTMIIAGPIASAEQLPLAEKSPPNAFIKLEDLNDMPYASKVVKESLRMASVVPWFPRLALQDCEIHGYKIKKGWNVNIDARSLHLDPTVYNDPDKFIPSRFDDESKPYSFLAFGQGGRTCLGVNLARAMMLVFLHRLVTTYKWKVLDSDSSVEKWALFARLKSGCPVRVTKIREDITPP
ncbi:hypothetical protein RHGRI_016038 [Rhododendron griersonianum]|uniref:Uncharacterized protein n=1 Tax=Rhododendron griersonianum TaxID=479676 RepID=A0AAV6JTE2_9ERIC|nr:hypothetical protein RHGRI_016038 [Rhododendron griersonianum]